MAQRRTGKGEAVELDEDDAVDLRVGDAAPPTVRPR